MQRNKKVRIDIMYYDVNSVRIDVTGISSFFVQLLISRIAMFVTTNDIYR